jgi:hypothetical protein
VTAKKIDIKKSVSIRPLYIRLPAPRSRCPYTGMSRSALADRCVPGKANDFRPPVKSIVLKINKYAKRGIRLIDYASLMKYLRAEFEKAA